MSIREAGDHTSTGPTKRTVVARAPTRIDLGGGWTDVPPYCEEQGGFVCNVAIDRFATVELSSIGTASDVSDSPALVRAALRRANLPDVRATLTNDFPLGAGLGGSSAASAALLTALREWKGLPVDPVEIAEEGRRIEVEDLGIAGGRQDHYAATHGGALALTFTASVQVERLALPAGVRREFVASCILIYTGESRISGDTIAAVLNGYRDRVPRVTNALASMRELARDMAKALASGDIIALGELLDEHWQHQRNLHPSITTSRIDEIARRASNAGALGMKAMGASGGGCVLIMTRPDRADGIRRSVADLGEILAFDVASEGAEVVRDTRGGAA